MERLAFSRKRQGREGQRRPRNGSSMKKATGGGDSMQSVISHGSGYTADTRRRGRRWNV